MLYSDRIADAASSDVVTDSNFAMRELHSAVFQSVVPSVQLFANLPLIKKTKRRRFVRRGGAFSFHMVCKAIAEPKANESHPGPRCTFLHQPTCK
jgi:hypothetical protein